MPESKKLSPPSTSNSKPASPPALSKDQVKGLLIDFMDQLAATKPPAATQQPKTDGQIKTTTETPDVSTTPKSPRLKEETLHGVRFVNESNPCPSSELLPNWSSKRRS